MIKNKNLIRTPAVFHYSNIQAGSLLWQARKFWNHDVSRCFLKSREHYWQIQAPAFFKGKGLAHKSTELQWVAMHKESNQAVLWAEAQGIYRKFPVYYLFIGQITSMPASADLSETLAHLLTGLFYSTGTGVLHVWPLDKSCAEACNQLGFLGSELAQRREVYVPQPLFAEPISGLKQPSFKKMQAFTLTRDLWFLSETAQKTKKTQAYLEQKYAIEEKKQSCSPPPAKVSLFRRFFGGRSPSR